MLDYYCFVEVCFFIYVTKLWVGQPMNCALSPGRHEKLFFLQSIHACCSTQPSVDLPLDTPSKGVKELGM